MKNKKIKEVAPVFRTTRFEYIQEYQDNYKLDDILFFDWLLQMYERFYFSPFEYQVGMIKKHIGVGQQRFKTILKKFADMGVLDTFIRHTSSGSRRVFDVDYNATLANLDKILKRGYYYDLLKSRIEFCVIQKQLIEEGKYNEVQWNELP